MTFSLPSSSSSLLKLPILRTGRIGNVWELYGEYTCRYWTLIKVLTVSNRDTGARFSKDPKTFRARKANSKIRSAYSWFFTMILRYERGNLLQIFMPGKVFVFTLRRKLWHPKCARKVSGVSRNARLVCFYKDRCLINDLNAWVKAMFPGVLVS